MSKKAVMNLDDAPDIMTVKHIAAVMSISINTAYEMVHSKGFPKVVIGKQYRIPKARFLEWLFTNAA